MNWQTLQSEAVFLLNENFAPPARYGTAFHVKPPVIDLRQLPLPSQEALFSVDQFEKLSVEQQGFFLDLSKYSQYGIWHLANLGKLGSELFYVPPYQKQSIIFQSPNISSASNVIWIVAGEGSEVVIEDNILASDQALRTVLVWQEANSRLEWQALRAQTKFLHENIRIELAGAGAKVQYNNFLYAKEGEQYDVQIRAFHKAPKTESNMTTRAAAKTKATIIERGLIDIDRKAPGSIGYQSGRALFLGERAVVDLLPELDIRTNDVRCSHGVTTTHLDDEALFYLRSRGLQSAEATRLALLGFFHDRLTIPTWLTNQLENIIEK